MAQPITVGVDGSPESLAAADWAAREAERRELPLRLVYARTWQPEPRQDEGRDEAQRRRQRPLDETARELRTAHPGLTIATELLPDQPETALPAETERAAMLVLGSRGLGRFAGFLLGSVGMQVLARAVSPVVMVRTGERSAAEWSGDEVVVGVQDLGGASDPVLRWAFTAARVRGVSVRAVRTWTLPPIFGYDPATLRIAEQQGALDEQERKQLTRALAPWREEFPGVDVVEQVELGDAAQTLVQAADRAALVVVGRRVRRSTLGIRTGPVTHAVLHHASCPVAVVPHD